MSKSEQMIRTKLKRILKAQARYILDNNNLSLQQKQDQMRVVEELLNALNNYKSEPEENQILTQAQMDRIEVEDMGYGTHKTRSDFDENQR